MQTVCCIPCYLLPIIDWLIDWLRFLFDCCYIRKGIVFLLTVDNHRPTLQISSVLHDPLGRRSEQEEEEEEEGKI